MFYLADNRQRYNLYIDSMPANDEPDQEQVLRILASALNVKTLSGLRRKAEEKVVQIKSVFARAMNKIIFDENLRAQESHQEMFSLLDLPPTEDSMTPR